MSVIDKFKPKRKDAEGLQQPSAADAPEAKPALRDVLVEKLRGLAEAGDVSAIRLLLDSPDLLTEPEPPKTQEDMVSVTREWFNSVNKLLSFLIELDRRQKILERRRNGKVTGGEIEALHEAFEHWLRYGAAMTALVAWERMTMGERCGMFNELAGELHKLGQLTEGQRGSERLVQ